MFWEHWMAETEEEQLIRRAQHDAQAFIALYDRYIDRIYGFVRSQTDDESLAKDVTSATFEKALSHIKTYQWRGVSFGAWLYRIAVHELAQQYRNERFTVPLLDSQVSNNDVEKIVEDQDEYNTLQTAFTRLSATDQQVIRLRFFEELSRPETAEIIGCSLPNLYLRLHRALNRLRELLKTIEITEETTHVAK